MILDNSPADSWIRITGVIVTYNNTLYQVVDTETNKKYIYWDADNPGTLKVSNVRLPEGNTQFLVVVNDNGKHTEVPINSSIFDISFDGNSRKNTEEQIWGLYETDEKHNEKFVVIEKDIDGIHQTVLEVQEDASHIKENMSLIDQRAENVNILVKEVTKNFGGSQENITLRENINKAIIKLNADLGTFSSNMSNYFNDNEITDEEKEKIDIELNLLDTDKVSLYAKLQKLIDKTTGVDLVAINTSKSALDAASTNLNSIINSVISDSIITPSDRILAINANAQYNLKINELKNTVDRIYITGMGGSISEEFSQINATAKEIKLEVARVDGATKTNAAEIKLTKDDITMMVTRNGSGSIVGIKPDKIEFGFNDISNYVEISRSGLTVNQGAIACDILTTPSGHEPIIRLFGSSRSGFAIDARQSDGASQASAIRLKYDSNNYFWVGYDTAEIYVDGEEHFIVERDDTFVRCGGATFTFTNGDSLGVGYSFYPERSVTDLGCERYKWRYLYARSTLSESDKKFKENIVYIKDIKNRTRSSITPTPFLDFIKDEFKPATFDYIAERDRTIADSQIGFIANDFKDSYVGKTFLYDYGEENGLMFSPSGYTTVVATALQEEIQKREELEMIINELNEKINNLGGY
ncbi:tail fiber domain-containing protein [Clostridioides difficile]|uniref:tail fiber domain-containing protein n=1 Tax=Clostridioides difficile TaxID=1496 RepID=UPI00093A0CF2|nr:tail fiber domain-containing protein [Clostridioides difficile]DAY96196.1 MAG TPA: Receptor recognition protein, Long tail, Helical sandwich, Tail fiber [Caudoviricetes sp.]EGT5157348.1 tail fiber domain-containing protein [Clostridioides difficile]EGT5564392.1 tail fiber domain-containing protein [Clostridioides difficile]EJA6785329.1 tail fiber domain-containing protein [Clostridioides difficile]EJX2710436.1 tail fiber domain-containing protein [Clostridioides difficile]